MKTLLPVLCVLAGLLPVLQAQQPTPFRVPTPQEQVAAVGRLDKLPRVQQRAFSVTNEYVTISKPGLRDWLASHPEEPQTFDGFLRSKRNIPSSTAGVIYILPLGEFPAADSPSLDDLCEYATAFFGLPVKVLPVAPLAENKALTRRTRDSGLVQYLTDDILSLLIERLPKDAFCLVGVTMEDLYPEESWNFVFGQATYEDRVGVFSFKRYTPAFNGQRPSKEASRLLLRRSCDVLVHETGHMFGIGHCTFFECTMCGSNHLQESDSRPMHICPVCLRKLHASARFDLVARCRQLIAFCEKHEFTDEAEWNKRMLARLTAP
jgi:archaemetzincin